VAERVTVKDSWVKGFSNFQKTPLGFSMKTRRETRMNAFAIELQDTLKRNTRSQIHGICERSPRHSPETA
jgi:hypothetical protein